MTSSGVRGLWPVLVASIAFATSSPLARLARPAHPLMIACGRVAIAALILGLLDLRGLLASARALSPRDRRMVVLSGGLLGGHFALFQWGLDQTSLAAAVALVSLEPLAVVLTAWAIFGIAPRRLEGIGVVVATCGALIVSRGAGKGDHRLFGDVLVLGAVVLFGFYIAAARGLKDALPARHYAPLVYGIAALVLACVLPVAADSPTARRWPLEASSIAMIGLIGLVPTVIGHTTIQVAARRLSPSMVALVCPAETLGSLLLGFLLLGGAPTWIEATGATVILLGAGFAILGQRDAARRAVGQEEAARPNA
ncbi:MAG: DMT family transporter [Polyangiaceae bacterium]|nr:DMT family transporter [Polyangiaceae bacterium]